MGNWDQHTLASSVEYVFRIICEKETLDDAGVYLNLATGSVNHSGINLKSIFFFYLMWLGLYYVFHLNISTLSVWHVRDLL